ncbi:PAS domain-containing protein [Methanococcoides methylutens]|uniref:PAS domain-containing protein n=1 Tax=Methanococcoides methylutens TaxID=2226 RepID=UPI004043BC06
MELDNHQHLTILMDSLLAGVVIIDLETHKIIDVNATAAKLIGSPKEKIIGNICQKYICPAECGRCPISDLDQTIDRSERSLLTNDGKEIPILKTATVINRDGRPCIVESFIDISNMINVESRLVHKLKVEKIVSSISSLFVFSDDLDLNINRALEEISKICGSSRTHIFLFDHDGTKMDNTHEYCKDMNSCQKEKLQYLSVDRFPWWMSKLNNGESIHIKDVSTLPEEASAEKEILEMQDISS